MYKWLLKGFFFFLNGMLKVGQPGQQDWMGEWGGVGSRSWKKWDHIQKAWGKGEQDWEKLSRNRYDSNPNSTDICLSILKKRSRYFLTSTWDTARPRYEGGWALLFSIAKKKCHVSVVSLRTLMAVLRRWWHSFLKSEENVKREEKGSKKQTQLLDSKEFY